MISHFNELSANTKSPKSGETNKIKDCSDCKTQNSKFLVIQYSNKQNPANFPLVDVFLEVLCCQVFQTIQNINHLRYPFRPQFHFRRANRTQKWSDPQRLIASFMLSKHNVSISHLVHMAVLNHKTLKSHLQRIQIRSYRSLVFTLVVFLKITVNIEYMITKTYKNKVWLPSALLYYTLSYSFKNMIYQFLD